MANPAIQFQYHQECECHRYMWDLHWQSPNYWIESSADRLGTLGKIANRMMLMTSLESWDKFWCGWTAATSGHTVS